jgi:hypothetical protein
LATRLKIRVSAVRFRPWPSTESKSYGHLIGGRFHFTYTFTTVLAGIEIVHDYSSEDQASALESEYLVDQASSLPKEINSRISNRQMVRESSSHTPNEPADAQAVVAGQSK